MFALEKFRTYLLGTKVILFSDHMVLKYLLKMKEAKPSLIWWILLLQKFDIKIKDKRGIENLVADLLCCLPLNEESVLVKDEFLYEHLFLV